MTELYACLFVIALTALSVAIRFHRSSKPVIFVIGAACVLAVLAIGTWISPGSPVVAEFLPSQNSVPDFVSSDACRSCHPGQHASWHQTYHRTMTQVAAPSTILAPFDGQELSSRGRTCRLIRKNDEFWVEMADPDWETEARWRGADLTSISDPPRTLRRIVMTTGSHHYQGYWVRSTRGVKLHQFPFVYHLEEQRWLPTEDSFLRPPDAERRFGVWNTNCIQCHAVAGQPRLDRRTEILDSQVAELGIACEACHGPGGAHVQKHQNPVTRYTHRLTVGTDSTIINPAECDHKISSGICGQCHSSFEPENEDDWWQVGYRYRAGGKLQDSYNHYSFSQDLESRDSFHSVGYWADGTQRIGGREYLGMIESACYERGEMSCLSCHSMHNSNPNDQLASGMDSDEACLQCHQSFRQHLQAHTHHLPSSEGSRCYNCHMPHTSYALFKSIRSHRIDLPNAESSAESGRPNACNLCHADQTLGWTSDYLEQWYDIEPASSLDVQQREVAAMVLWGLKGDAAQRAIVADRLAWDASREASGDGWQIPLLAQLLKDPYSAVRMVAWRALKKFPEFSSVSYDFIGTPEDRAAVSLEVLTKWRNAQSPTDGPRRSLLIKADGDIDEQPWQQLLGERDDTSLELPE